MGINFYNKFDKTFFIKEEEWKTTITKEEKEKEKNNQITIIINDK